VCVCVRACVITYCTFTRLQLSGGRTGRHHTDQPVAAESRPGERPAHGHREDVQPRHGPRSVHPLHGEAVSDGVRERL